MASPLSYTFGHATHVGLKRSENQDSSGKFPRDRQDGSRLPLFIVADGMGGHRGGREASQIAVHTIEEVFYGDPTKSVPERLHLAFLASNNAILEQSQSSPDLKGMGTTCTAMVLQPQHACIGHIGDSRAYRITPERMEQLTRDHTRVEEMVQQNILTPAEAAVHPQRNVLSRALGVRPHITIDVFDRIPLREGDRYLLCSDGLTYVSDEEIYQTVLALPPQAACDRLVQLANGQGGYDNVTVQIVQIDALPTFFNWSRLQLRLFSLSGLVLLLLLLALAAVLS